MCGSWKKLRVQVADWIGQWLLMSVPRPLKAIVHVVMSAARGTLHFMPPKENCITYLLLSIKLHCIIFSSFFNFWITKLKRVGKVWCLTLEHWSIPTFFSFDEVNITFQMTFKVVFCTKLYICVAWSRGSYALDNASMIAGQRWI